MIVLSRVSAGFSDLWDLGAILRVALDNVLSIMNGTVGGIRILNKHHHTLSYRVHKGLSDSFTAETLLSLGKGIAGIFAQRSKAIMLEDFSTDTHTAHHFGNLFSTFLHQ